MSERRFPYSAISSDNLFRPRLAGGIVDHHRRPLCGEVFGDGGAVALAREDIGTGDEWDRYETFQWRATARYADAHPDDPDVAELVARVAKNRHEYVTWGRDTLGWALYLFEKPCRQT